MNKHRHLWRVEKGLGEMPINHSYQQKCKVCNKIRAKKKKKQTN